jgi:hypothetical protein
MNNVHFPAHGNKESRDIDKRKEQEIDWSLKAARFEERKRNTLIFKQFPACGELA